ncbi:class I SAM-dependent methyltransferase [Paraburkholderia ultramafica]|uniref:class I SAM-dependent methyltransferase n=1 Tax=Paraburkholderia ultramafica TaxID=1544867 RepID=UPI001FE3B755|nr:class I SAM-dependent methyltransferase [Paraburkholderia ultramafica]
MLSQLCYPTGAIGHAVGDMMEHVNAAVIDTAYSKLDLQENQRILEVGVGNGGHLASVLTRAPRLRLAGVDVSPTMIAAARSRNAVFVEYGQVLLETASVAAMPFPCAVFDKAIAINAVYFWPDLTAGLREIRRVLCENGVLVIAAMTPETSLTMPFAEHGFQVYGQTALRNACFDAGFNYVQIERYTDRPSNPVKPQPAREFFLVQTSRM